MNKTQLAEALASITGETKSSSLAFINVLIEAIQNQLKTGDRVAIKGLGTFSVKPSPAREGRNPTTGTVIQIPASVKPKFTPATELKALVNKA